MDFWRKPIKVQRPVQLYVIQGEIINLLICTNSVLHFVVEEHPCNIRLKGFLANRMGRYKCIKIDPKMTTGAKFFVENINKCTSIVQPTIWPQ